jgi:hypothetical protein
MQEFKFELGIEAEDKITGFKGIVMSRSEHLTGCNVYSIAPKVLDGGKIGDTQWFDENRIKKISEGVANQFDKYNTGSTGNQKLSTSERR